MVLEDYNGFVERTESTKNDLNYIPKIRYNLNEAQQIMDIVPGFPVNKKLKYSQDLMIKAIQNGMIILISYTGEKDNWKGGRERVIYPMVLGQNRNTKNFLLRSWHLEGFSVKEKRETKKVWRLFNVKRIHWMMFVGNFYRLSPKGYKMQDKVMSEITIARADFAQIRRNQDTLIKAGKIESEEETKMSQKEVSGAPANIEIKNTGTMLDLRNPWDNELLEKKNMKDIKISILKTVFSNDYIALLGAIGTIGQTVKIYENKKLLGSYKTVASFTGDKFPTSKNINGKVEFDLFTFVKKM